MTTTLDDVTKRLDKIERLLVQLVKLVKEKSDALKK
jgi:hypothetical protein